MINPTDKTGVLYISTFTDTLDEAIADATERAKAYFGVSEDDLSIEMTDAHAEQEIQHDAAGRKTTIILGVVTNFKARLQVSLFGGRP